MKQFKVKYFSLIEVIASMAIFTILMLVMMNFFGKTQGLMTKRSSQASQYADAQAALELIGTQMARYSDVSCVKSDGSQLSTLQIVNSGNNRVLYYYTKETGQSGTNDTNLKLVGLWFDIAKNKLYYREKNLLPANLFTLDNMPGLILPTGTIGNVAGSKFATNWEEVIGNIVKCKIEYFDAAGTVSQASMNYPSSSTKVLPTMVKITITTVNDDDVAKYKILTNKAASDPIDIATDITNKAEKILTDNAFDIKSLTPAQQVLASSIREFTKTIYLGYRK